MYGSQWVGAVMSSLLQSECLMLQWLFPSQAVAYGLIYGYVTIFPCIISLICGSEPSILLVALVLCIIGDTMRDKISD